jgi:cell division protein FtsB
MSVFLHQIFYDNNKFGSGPPNNNATSITGEDTSKSLQGIVEELSKWSIPLPIYVEQIDVEASSFIENNGPNVSNIPTLQSSLIKTPEQNPEFTYETPSVVAATLCSGIPQNPETKSICETPKENSPKAPTTRNLVHHKIPANLSIFQSIFILHYGYSQYLMAGNRMLNRELEEKQTIMETLSKTPKKLKEGNHKLTNDNIQEILSGLLVATKEEIMHLIAYSACYNRIIYLVFTYSYLVFSPTKDFSIDASNIGSVYILNQTRKHPKYGGSYYPDLEPTLEKLENIHNTKIHLEHYAKPFKGVSAYNLPELEEMATKIGIFEKGVPVKHKKKELYDKIVEVCCAGICA